MPDQVIPIQDIASAGIVEDMPSVSLPPNVFSDAQNVRFRDGAVKKFPGETEILGTTTFANIQYAAVWNSTVGPKYVVVTATTATTFTQRGDLEVSDASVGATIVHFDPNTDGVLVPGEVIRFSSQTSNEYTVNTVVNAGDGNTITITISPGLVARLDTGDTVSVRDDPSAFPVSVFNENGSRFQIGNVNVGGMITSTGTPVWQHTEFNGGYHFILNNGLTTPVFLQADAANVMDLPNWDSYQAQEDVVEVEFSTQYADLSLGRALSTNVGNLTNQEIRVTVIPRDSNQAILSTTITSYGGANTFPGSMVAVALQPSDNDNDFPYINFSPTPAIGDTVRVAIVNTPAITVTAGVVRAYGNLLVAGNLRETSTAGSRVLPGTIRTSDVAAPGVIPANWNPFRVGVNTADEFLLASTGCVKDMAELQGVLYIYTDSSIHSVQQTGSPVTPFQIATVTSNFGADNVDGVIEVDGKHIVVGSDDVYVFAGHPGSISSIADGRVRDHFRDNKGYKVVRYNSFDELWFWRTNTTIYVWNYRNNTWTKRVGTEPVSLNSGNGDLVLASSSEVFTVNNTTTYLPNSFIERNRLALTPEFDTENLASIAMLASGSGTININVRGSNTPGDTSGIGSNSSLHPFNISNDYKTDIRVHGRFLNYRMTHPTTGYFETAGFQFDIGKGGTR